MRRPRPDNGRRPRFASAASAAFPEAHRREQSLAIFEGRQTLHAGAIDPAFLEQLPAPAPWSLRS